jgi:hypothetical protein
MRWKEKPKGQVDHDSQLPSRAVGLSILARLTRLSAGSPRSPLGRLCASWLGLLCGLITAALMAASVIPFWLAFNGIIRLT